MLVGPPSTVGDAILNLTAAVQLRDKKPSRGGGMNRSRGESMCLTFCSSFVCVCVCA